MRNAWRNESGATAAPFDRRMPLNERPSTAVGTAVALLMLIPARSANVTARSTFAVRCGMVEPGVTPGPRM